MITEKEQSSIRILSDNELYQQAVDLMNSIGGTLPSTQINGLLNVTFANTYDELEKFVNHQRQRTTWPARERHVPDFYFKLARKLKDIELYVPSILQYRQEKSSKEDQQVLKMLLAREFIQHLLAENAYRGVRTPNNKPEGRPQGGNRGPSTR